MIGYIAEKKYTLVSLWIGLKALLGIVHYRFYDIAVLGYVSVWLPFLLGVFLLISLYIAEKRIDGKRTSTALWHLVLGLSIVSLVCFLEL